MSAATTDLTRKFIELPLPQWQQVQYQSDPSLHRPEIFVCKLMREEFVRFTDAVDTDQNAISAPGRDRVRLIGSRGVQPAPCDRSIVFGN
jgi:hypothetical protein